LPEKERLIKQINKLMFGKIIEISIIIVLVGLSIPAWSAFAKIGDINVIKIEDCKLNFKEKKDNATDFLTIENNYAINKNYKIYLDVDKNTDFSTEIVINNKGYKKLESVMPTVIEYIRIFGFDIKNGHILIDPKNLIYSYYDYLMLDEVRLDEVSLTRSEDETLTRGDFSSKEASEMSSVDESIFSDIFYRRPSVASYYVPREEMISDYTFEIFEREIIKMLVQLVVGAINNNQDSIRVDFIVNHNSVVFNNKE